MFHKDQRDFRVFAGRQLNQKSGTLRRDVRCDRDGNRFRIGQSAVEGIEKRLSVRAYCCGDRQRASYDTGVKLLAVRQAAASHEATCGFDNHVVTLIRHSRHGVSQTYIEALGQNLRKATLTAAQRIHFRRNDIGQPGKQFDLTDLI